jgi:mannose-6-phosphate isomerase-like protein (cupin superfamily)
MENHKREEHRPWGFYEVLSQDKLDHKVKRITVWPGKRLSLQYHQRRSEHWVVVSGCGLVWVDGKQVKLVENESIDIPLRAQHRIENIGDEPLVFIEVQQGEYFGEDDIVRVEDDFGRS